MASPAWPVQSSAPSPPGQPHWQPPNAEGQIQHGVFPGYPAPPFRGPPPNQLNSSPGSSNPSPNPNSNIGQPMQYGHVRWRGESSVLGARPPAFSSGPWILSPPGQAQRAPPPPFMYPPNFPFMAHPFRGPLGDPFAAAGGPAFGVWGGGQIDPTAAAAVVKELPDFHAHRVVNSEDKVSDSKSEKNLKLEVSEEDAWAAHKTEDGVIYYYNSVSGESTYEKPANFKGEANAMSQPTPIACDKLPGTDWLLVTTNDGKKYYYNPKTQATSWQVPAEIVDKVKKDDGGPISTPAALTGGREAKGATPNGPTALDTVKKKLQENVGSVAASPETEGAKDTTDEAAKDKPKANPEASTSDSSSESEDEGPSVTKEERVQQFKDLLKETGVARFSKWEKELPKILFDPRFKAIASHTERRSIFEHYVRTRAEEERKEKRAAQKAAADGFKQLLDESASNFSHNTTYESFASSWSQDPRFEALDRKDREVLLNERILPLRKAEEDRHKAIYEAVASEFRAMLKERSDVNANTRWSKVRDLLRHDPRYKAVKHEDREEIFNIYVAGLRAAEQEVERAARAKREEENKLRDRERELRKRKERDGLELERVKAKARRKDAVTGYQALLTEKIKDAEASWTESRPKLERDPLGRASNPELDMSDRERLFREHVKELYERCEKDFKVLLADVFSKESEGKDVMGSWNDAKAVLKLDQRFNRMPRRYAEAWWQRYVQDVQRKQSRASDDKDDAKDNPRSSSRRHM